MSSQVMTDMSSPVMNEAEPIEAKENASVLAETPGGVTESGSEKGDDPVIDGLVADFVAMRFAVTGKQPRVKKNWHRDMRLLVERGDSNYEPEKLDPMKVSRLIQWLGANPSWPETDPKFAWAEVIQSPAGLRNKWEKVRRPAAAEVKRREGSSSPAHRVGPEVNLDYSTGVGVPVSEMDEEDLMISPLMA